MDFGSIAGPLFIVFLILKLTHHIAWSWWWVTSPLWIDVGLSIILAALFGTAALAVGKWFRA